MIKMTATQRVQYGSKNYNPGDTIPVANERDAKLLRAVKKATDFVAPPPPPMRSYRAAAVRAEAPAPAPSVYVAPKQDPLLDLPTISEDSPKSARPYKRRDMSAEE